MRKTALMIGLLLMIITSIITLGTTIQSVVDQDEVLSDQKVYEITLDEFKNKNLSYCDGFNYEIIDIYGKDDTCSRDAIWFYLDDDLKKQGFETVYTARGN